MYFQKTFLFFHFLFSILITKLPPYFDFVSYFQDFVKETVKISFSLQNPENKKAG